MMHTAYIHIDIPNKENRKKLARFFSPLQTVLQNPSFTTWPSSGINESTTPMLFDHKNDKSAFICLNFMHIAGHFR